MIGASFLPSRLRGNVNDDDTTGSSKKHHPPNVFTKTLTNCLLQISKGVCRHPIYTLVLIAGLASTQYRSLLETSTFFDSDRSLSGPADFSSLLSGSKSLRVDDESTWKWDVEETSSPGDENTKAEQHLALLTLVFPDTLPEDTDTRTAPIPKDVILPANSSAKILPSSPNPLSSLSSQTTMAYAVPYAEAPQFLTIMQEIAPPANAQKPRGRESGEGKRERRMWIMKAVKSPNVGGSGLITWAQDTWTEFLDLLKNAETLDICIMFLGYLTMHLTFVSLFLSMRQLGSNFWLATTTLISSCFAFLFGLVVTTKFGVAINVLLLSEGLPFLVVIIGFEKPIVLTKAVLSASLDIRREGAQSSDKRTPLNIQTAVQNAVKSRGVGIVRDYFIEIAILSAGAASGVQGGLRQFCFLGAWILFFDCILLFTFYTAILTIKLEINRIKRHVALRKALEDDGVSKRVAENVATNNDWPGLDDNGSGNGRKSDTNKRTIFGRTYQANNIPKFKVLMVSGFVLVNLINVCTIPFRTDRNPASPAVSGLSSVVGQPPMDPFKVAGAGLDDILQMAKQAQLSTVVTVLSPIKYELEYPSIHYAGPSGSSSSLFDSPYTDHIVNGVGGGVVGGVLKSFEDPAMSKWLVALLVMSVVLNGYLFNAARWTIQQSPHSVPPPKDREVMDIPQTPVSGRTEPPTPALNAQSAPLPLTPAATEAGSDEGSEEESVPRDLNAPKRTYEECEAMLKDKKAPLLEHEELIALALRGKIPGYALEKTLGDYTRAVAVRRALVARTHATRETSTLLENSKLPYKHYNYNLVHGACCENVVGYLPLPLGVAGPLRIDGQNYFLPMATTEGVLVASTSRGCKAINAGGGATTVVTADGMTRGPVVTFETLARTGEAKIWLDSDEGQQTMKSAFNSTSRFARLTSMKTVLAGTNLFIRFKATTGDAMGMNMISKGVERALETMAIDAGFSDMTIVSLSGNFCIDKKPAALNWIDGRGKSVAAEAIIPAEIVKSVLKTEVDKLVDLNVRKNLVGSAMAGSIGGQNAHVSNIVAAMFIATGQDPAQVVESANCITLMSNVNGNLQISVSMPSIEVGTIGGGTILEPQSAMLDLLGVRGAHPTSPGGNAQQLARVIASACLAAELSLCSALAAGHLVKAHMSHNRSQQPSRAGTPSAEKTQGSAPAGLAPMTTRR